MRVRTVEYCGKLLPRPLRRNSEVAKLHRLAKSVADDMEAAIESCGVGIHQVSAAGVVGMRVCRVTHVDISDPLRVVVELHSGLTSESLIAASRALAEALRVPTVRVRRLRPGYVEITVGGDSEWPEFVPHGAPLETATQPAYVGYSLENGDVRVSMLDGAHWIAQGTTRTGKTTFLYSLLSQFAECPDVVVAGSDPSGILLRPWTYRRDQHAGWQAVGMSNPVQHVEVLRRLVKLMDARIAGIPEGADKVPVSVSDPLMLVVLEEFPALVTSLRQESKKLYEEALGYYLRLLSESAKAGFRLLVVAQRADAEVLGGGYARSQISTRLSFALDSPDSLSLLHPSADRAVLGEHVEAPDGRALLSRRKCALDVVQVPYVTVQDYWKAVVGEWAQSEVGNVLSPVHGFPDFQR